MRSFRSRKGATIGISVLAHSLITGILAVASAGSSAFGAAVPSEQEHAVPPPLLLRPERTQADSVEILERSREAQRRFERLRVRHLPTALSSSSGPCDERVGRMCYWHGDNDYEPDPEAPEIIAARETLLDTLANAARQLSGDSWISGQRVHYLIEAGRAQEALSVARRCRAQEDGWCAALRGLALHRLERFGDSEQAFRTALEAMDGRSAEEWRSPEPLLERSDHAYWSDLPSEARGPVSRWLWSLSDPYYLVRGNDRWTEHLSRHVQGRILSRAANPHGLPWTAGLDELAIRYGHETSWTRSIPTVGSGARPVVTGRHRPHAERYLPPDGILVESRPGTVWGGEAPEKPRSAYAPSYAARLGRVETVVSRFRRNDSLLLVTPFRYTPPDTSGGVVPPPTREGPAQRGQAGLFLLPWNTASAEAEPRVSRTSAERGTLTLKAPLGDYLYSIEVLDRDGGTGARERGRIALAPHPADIPDLSDLVVIDGTEQVPESLREVITRILPSSALGRLQELMVGWEVYGLGAGEAEVGYSLVVRRLDRSFFRRVGAFLRLGGSEEPLVLEWREPSPEGPGIHFRSVAIELGNLDPGSYELRLELRVAPWAPVIRRRRILVTG